MQTAETPTNVLYVTGRANTLTELSGCRLSAVTPGNSSEWPGRETVDCLLVGRVGPGETVVGTVERVRERYPSTPLVAFTADSVEDALEAGATDVVQSSPADTPGALVRRRVESAREPGEVPGVPDHGSYTHEDLLSQLSENMRDVIWVDNPNSPPGQEVEFVSQAYEEVWGRPREHLLAGGVEAFLETVHPEDRDQIRRYTGSEQLTDEDTDLTYRVVQPDGEIRWVHDRLLGVYEDGKMVRAVGIARDITEHRARERELTQQQEALDTILSNAPVVLFTLDEDGVFTRSRGQGLAPLSLDPGDAVGESVFEMYEDRPDICDHCKRALDGEQVAATVEIEGRTLESWYQPLYDDGAVVGVVGHSYDVTERVQQQDQLEQQNDLFSKAQEIADVGAWEYNFEGPNLWTEQVYDIFGAPEDTPLTLAAVKQYYHPVDWPRVSTAIDRAIENGESFDLEARLVTETDDPRWVHLRGDAQTADGEVVRVRGTVQDITERRRREQELERSREFLERVQQVSDVGGWEYDFRTDTLRLTDAVCALLDLPAGTTLTSEELVECHHPDDQDRVIEAVTDLWTDGEPFDLELRVVTGNSGPQWVYSKAAPVYEDGEVVGMRGVSRDIDERKGREQRLERQNDLFSKAQEIADVGAWAFDCETGEGWSSQKTCSILDLPADGEMGPLEAMSVFHPEDQERIRSVYQRALEEAEPYDETLRLASDGETRGWVRARGEPQVENGEVVRVRGTVQDITDRVEREQQLQAERDLVERILETSPVGIIVHDDKGTVLSANEQTAEILGVEPGRIEAERHSPDSMQVVAGDIDWSPEEELLVERVARTGQPVRDQECTVELSSGERVTLVVDAVPLFEDGTLHRIIVTLDDVTERVERENRLESRREELVRLDRINRIIRDLDTALVGASTRPEVEQAVCDQLSASGRYERVLVFRAGDGVTLQATCDGVEQAAVDRLRDERLRAGLTHRVAQSRETYTSAHPDDDTERAVREALGPDPGSVAAIPLTYNDQTHGVLVVSTGRPGQLEDGEVEVLGELGQTVGHAIGAAESRQREARLRSLYRATQDLLAAEDPESVCEVVIETAESVLDPLGIGIFLFDDAENVLELTEGTDRMFEFYGESTAFGPGKEDSITWQSFVEGERIHISDVHDSEHLANVDTDAKSSLFLPLDDHGVFVVSTAEQKLFDEQARSLVGLLATTTEAALDRVVDQEGIRERDRRLDERAARLAHLEGLFSMVGDVDAALHGAKTREELERDVCERLVETDPYEFAWVGAVQSGETTLDLRTWADNEARAQEYLDSVSLSLDDETPAARAARTGRPVSIPNVTDHLREADWARAAVERDYESVLAVPLTHERVTYGVLVVYATEPDAFDELARSVFDRLGTLVPQVSTTLQRDRTVLADRVVELELSLPEADAFPNAVAAAVDHPVQYRQVTPAADGRNRLLFELPDPSVADIREVAEQFVSVESLDVVERTGETTLRVTLAGSTVSGTVLSCGAIPNDVVARAHNTTVTARLPHDADVRLFLDRMDGHYPEVDLLARRDVTVRDGATFAARRALDEDLTDRQREVLWTAYEHGFFESPRATTGVELADLLGVSQPTVTHHLREAQRRLFAALFESG